MDDLAVWQSLGVALAAGLLVGGERERSRHPGDAGVRTFALAALAGCLAALAGAVVLAACVAGAGLLVAVAYVRTSTRDAGATTEIALLLTVLLGGLAASRPALAAGAAVATTVVLASKERMHRFLRDNVTDVELTDALKFFVVALIVLPLVPHAELGPYGVIDPRRIWTLVVAITGIGWLGYLAVRLLGPKRGLPVAGFAGGFVSGAVTTGAMARRALSPGWHDPALAGAVLASLATLVQLLLVTAVADIEVSVRLIPAVVLGATALLVEAVWLARRGRRGASDEDVQSERADADPPEQVSEQRPFALRPALVLAVVLTGILVLARWAEDLLGTQGVALACAAAGLADAHAGAVAAATLSSAGAIGPTSALIAVGAALLTNTGTKIVLAFSAGGRRIGTTFAALLAAPALAVAAGLAASLTVWPG
jgi:uncharacterized membrane protein (DUF4010 family)